MEFFTGFCTSAPSFCSRKDVPGLHGTAGALHKGLEPESNASLMDQLRPTVVDLGEIQFPRAVPARTQPRGSSAPHQGTANRLLNRSLQYTTSGSGSGAVAFTDTGHSLAIGAMVGGPAANANDRRWLASMHAPVVSASPSVASSLKAEKNKNSSSRETSSTREPDTSARLP
mmetsp:Transcript_85616/g.134545  ORF Transcript_85616/g.134545 Transcript_85616/m.134545 type:complete len:172 (+) Transcript_85616:102-617(+)